VNHTYLVVLATLVAATLVIATLAAAPALADSSKTVVKQSNKQKLRQHGIRNSADQDASNCIAVLNGANACRQQGEGVTPPTPPGRLGCPEGTVFDVTLRGQLPPTGTPVAVEDDVLCLSENHQGANTATVVHNGVQQQGTINVEVTPLPQGQANCPAGSQQVAADHTSGTLPQGSLGEVVCVNLQGG
jgi:hypothetical protein